MPLSTISAWGSRSCSVWQDPCPSTGPGTPPTFLWVYRYPGKLWGGVCTGQWDRTRPVALLGIAPVSLARHRGRCSQLSPAGSLEMEGTVVSTWVKVGWSVMKIPFRVASGCMRGTRPGPTSLPLRTFLLHPWQCLLPILTTLLLRAQVRGLHPITMRALSSLFSVSSCGTPSLLPSQTAVFSFSFIRERDLLI